MNDKIGTLSPGEDRRAGRREGRKQFVAGQNALLASLECIEQGICVVDPELRFAGFNSQFFDLLDIHHDLFRIGDSYEDFVRHISSRGNCRPSEMEFLVSERVRGAEPTAFGEQVAQRNLPNGTTLEIRYNPMPDGGFVCVYSDITDQKQAESLRRDSEQRALSAERHLIDAIESIPEGFAIFDHEDKLALCNNAYRALFLNGEAQIVPGAAYEDVLRAQANDFAASNPDDDVQSWVRQRLERRQRPSDAFEQKLTDGRWILVSEQQTGDGRTVSVLTDITSIKSRESALQKSEERFEKAFHASPAIISVTSLQDGRIYNVNDTWCDTLGFPRDEAIGKSVLDFDIWVDASVRKAVVAKLKNGEAVRHMETHFRARGGAVRDFIFSAEVTEYEGEECLLFFGHDISPQKEIEHALSESEQRYRDFTNVASDWVWETDEDMRFTYLSERVLEIAGFPAEWHYGKTREEVGLSPADPQRWEEFQQLIAARKPFRDLLLTRELADGRVQWLRSSGMPVFDEVGTFKGYRGAGAVMTELFEAKNLADEAVNLLSDAIENLPVGFSLFDQNDRLVAFNQRYRDVFWRDLNVVDEGRSFADMAREVMRLELLADMPPDPDRWIQERTTAHQGAGYSSEVELANGRWFRIEEHGTSGQGKVAIYADITPLKEREAALRESEARLQDYVETATDVMWETDTDHRFTFLSSRVRADAPGGTDHLLGRTRWDAAGVTDPHGDPRWREHLGILDRREAYRDFHYDSTYVNGDVVHVRSSGKPVFDAHGEFLGYRGTAVDETEQVEAQRRAEAAEAMLTDAIESVPIGIGIFDERDVLVQCNEPYRHTLAGSPHLVELGLSYGEICLRSARIGNVFGVDPNDDDAIKTWMAARMLDHLECAPAQEAELTDGRWLRVEEHPTSTGGRVAIRTDITTLKNREQALQQSELRFRSFAESSSDWLWETDENHRFAYVSIDVRERYALDIDTVLGKTRWEISPRGSVPEDLWRQHHQDLEARRPFRDFKYPWLVDESGRQLYLSVSGTPVFHEDRTFRGYRGVVSDITTEIEADLRAEQAESMLVGTIESADGGFIFFDQDDRLITCNRMYRSMFSELEDLLVPGRTYEEILAATVDRGLVSVSDGAKGNWIRDRLQMHREGTRNYDVRLDNGRWVRLMEYRGSDGSTIGFRTDITELKQNELALQQSEARFKDFAEAASDWFWEMDTEFRFTSVSENFAQAAGAEPEFLIGRTCWELAGVEDPESDKFWRNHLADVQARRPFRDLRYSVQVSGGMLLFVRVHGKPVFDEGGEFRGYRGVGIDETARILAAERAEIAERRLTQTIDTADGGIAVFDADDRLVMCNSAFGSQFPNLRDLLKPGTAYESLVRASAERGLAPHAVGHEEDWIAEQLDLHRSGTRNLDQELDGGRWVRITEYRTPDGGTISFRSDITELKQRERQLEEQTQTLERTLESMDQGIAMVDSSMKITLHNRRVLELLDLPSDFVENYPMLEEFVRFNAQRGGYGPGDIDQQVETQMKWFESIDKPRVDERTLPDGTVLEVRRIPTSDSGFVSVFTDVTLRNHAQAQLIQSAKLATLGEMATSLAHELNQPLNVIRMAADSTLERIADGDRDIDNVQGKLERISRQTVRAAAIIDHMRIFGRKSDGELQSIDPRDTIEGVLTIMTERLRLHSIDLLVDMPDSCTSVMGHAVQLEQVILNILGNAFDALEGRDISQGPKSIDIRIADRTSEGNVEIVVEDTGGGIKDEVITRLFEPFVTTKEIGKGTGLGLSISYGIITDMGGTIEAGNAERGTQIKITLPVPESALEPA